MHSLINLPGFHKWYIDSSPRSPRSEIEGSRRPQESDPIGRIVSVQRRFLHERLDVLRQLKLLLVIGEGVGDLGAVAVRYGVDQGIEVEGRQIWILSLDEDYIWGVVPVQYSTRFLSKYKWYLCNIGTTRKHSYQNTNNLKKTTPIS